MSFIVEKKWNELIFPSQEEISVTIDGNKKTDLLESWGKVKSIYEHVMQTDCSVYSLCGNWGTGKTFLVKAFESVLEKNDFSVVYIDAYKNDYITDPFSMIIKAFRKYIRDNKVAADRDKMEVFANVTKELGIALAKNTGKFAINLILSKIMSCETQEKLFDSIKSGVSEVFSSGISDVIDGFEKEKDETEELYDKFIEATEDLLSNKGELVIIIDELDRCRPDFALEVFEKIKHIFTLKGLKFVLVYNEEIIKSVIQQKYGLQNEVLASAYVRKFIEHEVKFDANVSYERFISNLLNTEEKRGLDRNSSTIINSRLSGIDNMIRELSIPLREVEYSFRNIRKINISDYENDSIARLGSKMIYTSVVIELWKCKEQEKYKKLRENVNEDKSLNLELDEYDVLKDYLKRILDPQENLRISDEEYAELVRLYFLKETGRQTPNKLLGI